MMARRRQMESWKKARTDDSVRAFDFDPADLLDPLHRATAMKPTTAG